MLAAVLVSVLNLPTDSALAAAIFLGTTGNAAQWLITGAGATAAPAFQTAANHTGEISITGNGFRTGTFVSGGTLAAFNGFWFADATFTLPPNASDVALTFDSLYGNDRVVLQLNGAIIGNADHLGATGPGLMSFPPGPPDVPYTFTGTTSGTITSGFLSGVNTLRMIINNTGVGPISAPTATFANPEDATDAFLNATVTYNVPDLNGSDDFNDDSKDPARWGSDFLPGVGLLTETNGRLEYTTSGVPTSLDLAARPWRLNFGRYTQDWETRIEVNVPQRALPETRLGLLVAPGADFNNNFRVDLVESSAEGRYFACNLDASGDKVSVGHHATPSTSAALRIAFDADTTVLSAFYDEDGASCGYSWTFLGATNVPAAWNMSATDLFTIWVFGYVKSGSTASADNVFADNFAASTGATPNLGISLAAGKVVLAWSTNTSSCQLEVASTLAPPVCWEAITNVPSIVGSTLSVTNPASSDKGFYRLSR
jgi:hypothetical protein